MADISPLCTSLELFLVWCSFLQLPVLYYRKYVVAGGRVAEGAQRANRAPRKVVATFIIISPGFILAI